MANPADAFSEVTRTMGPSQNRAGIDRIREKLDSIHKGQFVEAVIKTVDNDYGGVFTVDLFRKGYGVAPTHTDIPAIAVEPKIVYQINTPCRVISFSDGSVGIITCKQPFCYKLDATAWDVGTRPTVVSGWPCHWDGSCYLEDFPTRKTKLHIDFSYSSGSLPAGLKGPAAGSFVFVEIYDFPPGTGTNAVVGCIQSGAAAAAVNIFQNDVLVQAAASHLNSFTNQNLLQWAARNVAGQAPGGVEIKFKDQTAGETNYVLQWNGGNWVLGPVKAL